MNVTRLDDADRQLLGGLFKLPAAIFADMAHEDRPPRVTNYRDFIHLNVSSVLPPDNPRAVELPPKIVALEMVVGKRWLITLHPEDLSFLKDFREQDRGETSIGVLSATSLASSLLDWHLAPFLAATEQLAAFCDEADLKILTTNGLNASVLPHLMAARRFVARLVQVLAPQREVFYGLLRPDVKLVIDDEASQYFSKLELRFERVLDVVENGRSQIKDSLELHSAHIAETTNVLLRRLTVLSVLLGVIGAAAGIFGMNFDTSFSSSGETGFWIVIACLSSLVVTAILVSRWLRWI